MRLTEEQREAIPQKLKWCCTVCGKTDAVRELVDVVELSVSSESCIPAALVMCCNCKHLQMFAVNALCPTERT